MSYQTGIQIIKDFADTLSTKAGVYRMVDAHNQVLYVGKAKNLRARVLSYTRADAQSLRIRRMIFRTRHMEFVETASESDALLLEADLIKSLKPYYNILLRDDKSYPEIELSFDKGMAQIKKHRGVHRAECQYFGPFSNARAVNKTIAVLRNVFYLAPVLGDALSTDMQKHRIRYHAVYKHQFMRSFVPDGKVDDTDFYAYVQQVIGFLSGKDTDVLQRLHQHMQQASDTHDFEGAMVYRDRLRALQDLHISQGNTLQGIGDADVFALSRWGKDTVHAIICVQILFYRNSMTAGSAVFFPRVDLEMDNGDILIDFINQYYGDTPPAKKVLVSHAIADSQVRAFHMAYGAKIHCPKAGVGKKVVHMAMQNAISALNRHKSHITTHNQALHALCEVLHLADLPERIEVYDNSHHQGDVPVGAMIVVNTEGFDKKSYRTWDIKTAMNRRDGRGQAGDDYAMMEEVLTRRFTRAINEKSVLPDVIVVDGGKGQVSTAQKVLHNLGVSHIPLICVAKGKNRNDGTETFYTATRQIPIAVGSDLHFFMERIRDESHRFAIDTHRKKRRKKMLTSPLDTIGGIGKIKRTKLLQYFGSSTAISGAGMQDLMRVEGINKALAEKIYNHFNKS